MFYVASNVSQNHLSCLSVQALNIDGHNFPRIGSASNTPRGYTANTLNPCTSAHDDQGLPAPAPCSPTE